MTELTTPETVATAKSLLEKSQARMIRIGWQPDASTGEQGQRCIVNTLWEEGLHSQAFQRGALRYYKDAVLNLCKIVLEDVIARDHPCNCPLNCIAADGSLIMHFNDHHCESGGQAVSVYSAALKELQEMSA